MTIKYRPGDCVIKCRPLCQALFSEEREHRCDFCIASSSSLKKCGKCRLVSYCGKTCQVNDWKGGHKYECNVYATCRPDLIKDAEIRFMLRLYLLVAKGHVETKQFTLHDGRQRCLTDLVSHEDEMKLSKSEDLAEFIRVIVVLTQLLNYDLDKDLVLRLFCQAKMNRFNVPPDDTHMYEDIGYALYIEGSTFDHSCEPNAVALFRGNEMEIRVIKTIEEGKQVFLDYIDERGNNFVSTKQMRQEYLRKRYFFTCTCTRCQSDFDLLMDRNKLNHLNNRTFMNANMKRYKEAYQSGIQLMPFMRQLFGEFHPIVSGLIVKLLWIGTLARTDSQKDFQDLADKLEKNMEITMIKDGIFYEKCEKLVLVARGISRLPAPMVAFILDDFEQLLNKSKHVKNLR